MAFTFAINFRNTNAFVSDVGTEVHCTSDLAGGVTYPVTSGGATWGWVSGATVSFRDRTSTIDRRLAGDNFAASGDVFQVLLPATGAYYIWAAFGDNINTSTLGHSIADDTTTIQSYSGSLSSGFWQDATGAPAAGLSLARWPGENKPIQYNFQTTLFKVVWGAGNDGLSHLRISDSNQRAGPSRLFIRDRTSQGVPTYRDLNDSRGAAMVTGVVNTNASAEAQWTKTAGGAVLTWISGPVPAGGFTLSGQMTFNLWALESAIQANAGARARVFKWSGGVETELAGGPWSRGVEFGTTAAVQNWTGTPSAGMVFAAGDRMVVKFYIAAVGTMGSGQTCTVDYDGPTNDANGDAWLEMAEGVTFGPPEPFPPYLLWPRCCLPLLVQ